MSEACYYEQDYEYMEGNQQLEREMLEIPNDYEKIISNKETPAGNQLSIWEQKLHLPAFTVCWSALAVLTALSGANPSTWDCEQPGQQNPNY